uniref:Uncharacterized protein n=1 Tax=Leersia perrieri TaxID=77586 RepID=A0A0D9XEC2_9ORYZ
MHENSLLSPVIPHLPAGAADGNERRREAEESFAVAAPAGKRLGSAARGDSGGLAARLCRFPRRSSPGTSSTLHGDARREIPARWLLRPRPPARCLSPQARLPFVDATRLQLPRRSIVFFADLIRLAVANVWLRQAMGVRISVPVNTSLMTMRLCGWLWGLRSFVAFLAEQPRQLKHLEWPGFRNTLRTATLTLILVVVFIVVLSSVDAALCYILSWLLRKSAYRGRVVYRGERLAFISPDSRFSLCQDLIFCWGCFSWVS